jgi:membrane fusion protein (multidrug efflux system)
MRALAVLVAMIPIVLACGSGSATGPSAAQPQPVRTVAIVTAPLDETATATGVLEAVASVELRAESSGMVVDVGFADGDKVDAGKRLLLLRPDAANAASHAARSQLLLEDARLERMKALHGSEYVSTADLEAAQGARDLAAANVEKARDDVRKTEVVAPFAGVVGKRGVQLGDYVDPTYVITRIDDLSAVYVDAAFPEPMLPALHAGQAVHVAIDAFPGEAFTGTLTYVAPRLDPSTRMIEVRTRIPNTTMPDGSYRLRPGLGAEITVTVASRDAAVVVPAEALVASAAGNSVWVGPRGHAHARPTLI